MITYTCNRCKGSVTAEVIKDENIETQYNKKIKEFRNKILEHNSNKKFYQNKWSLQSNINGLVGIVEKSNISNKITYEKLLYDTFLIQDEYYYTECPTCTYRNYFKKSDNKGMTLRTRKFLESEGIKINNDIRV